MLRIILVLALCSFDVASAAYTGTNGVCDWSGYNPSDGTCVCPAGGTKLIDIGARSGPTDYGNVLGYTCPVSVDVSNWASSDTFPDVFVVSQDKASGRLLVQRSDTNGGWGMGLQFDCCANVCTCPNGTPTVATGSGATVCHVQDSASKFHDCSACNSGYTLSTAAAATTLSTCVLNTCTCANGTPTVWNGGGANSCATNGDEDCYACGSGYELSDGPHSSLTLSTCVAITCTCANGTPTVWNGGGASVCEASAEDCQSCDAGYTLNKPAAAGTLSTCVANVCTCENGTPTLATGAGAGLCETNGVEDCSACDEGFDFFLGGIAAAGTFSTCDVPGACFHGDGTLLLESGATKKFSELALGERIKTSDGRGGFSFNPVLTLPHKNNTEPAAFVALTTETGKKVDMTSDHIIPKCDGQEVTAGALVVGDCVLTADGKETLMEVSSTAKIGVFTAITQDKFIVVDGVIASSFSKDSDPAKPERDYKKYRLELAEERERKLAMRLSKHQKRVEGAHA